MSKKILIIIIIPHIFAIGVGVFGGMKYSESKGSQGNFSAQGGSALGGQNLQNLSPEERQQRFQKMGVNGGAFRTGRSGAQNGGFASGEIISKDDKSITVKTLAPNQNANSSGQGSTKIIFYSSSTEIGKSV